MIPIVKLAKTIGTLGKLDDHYFQLNLCVITPILQLRHLNNNPRFIQYIYRYSHA